jgi:hypothetical protein
MPLQLSYVMEASVLPGMSAATAASRRSSIWSTISTCCARSRAHWQARLRWRSGGRRALAGVLRSVVAGVEPAPWPIRGHAADDRAARTRPRPWLGSIACAVEQTLSMGCHDGAAIRHLLTAEQLNRPRLQPSRSVMLARYERPLPVMTGYDQLLTNTMEVHA